MLIIPCSQSSAEECQIVEDQLAQARNDSLHVLDSLRIELCQLDPATYKRQQTEHDDLECIIELTLHPEANITERNGTDAVYRSVSLWWGVRSV